MTLDWRVDPPSFEPFQGVLKPLTLLEPQYCILHQYCINAFITINAQSILALHQQPIYHYSPLSTTVLSFKVASPLTLMIDVTCTIAATHTAPPLHHASLFPCTEQRNTPHMLSNGRTVKGGIHTQIYS